MLTGATGVTVHAHHKTILTTTSQHALLCVRMRARAHADDPDLLRNRSIPERALVISAGVIANILFAYSSLVVQVCGSLECEVRLLGAQMLMSYCRRC
jgi:hypothetical protein